MNLSDFPPDVQEAAAAAVVRFLRDERCGTAVRFGMIGGTHNAVAEAICHAISADRAGRLNVSGLTSRQAECLRFIAAHQRDHDGITPSFAEIADGLGLVSKSGVVRLVTALEKRGRILRPANRSRAITIITNGAHP